ncbi:WD40 repeat domain-containing protein [Undibacterium sp. Di27W]
MSKYQTGFVFDIKPDTINTMRIRHLTDSENDKTWSSFCEGANVHVSSGAKGKEKESDKSQDTPTAALAWAEKEEWSRIKKGFVLDQLDAQAGEPRMHRLRSKAYTGALPIADIAGQMLCNSFDDTRPGDRLYLLDASGQQTALPDLPLQRLAWKAIYLPTLQRLLIKADHQVLSWAKGDTAYTVLSAPNQHPVSCLDAQGSLAVWYAEPHLVVTDLHSGQQLLKLPLPYELYGGHTSQMEAALSPDGATLAYCACAGEIVLLEIATGAVRATIAGDFKMIKLLKYSADGGYLIAETAYGNNSHLCFDMQSMALRPGWPASSFDGRTTLALSPDGKLCAIANGNKMQIYDFITLECTLSFRIEHVVKRCSIGWVGQYLGVQTDYGCASLYALG